MMAKIGFSIAVIILVLLIGLAAGVLGARVLQPSAPARVAEPAPEAAAAPRAAPTPVALPPAATPTPDTGRQLVSAFIPSYQDLAQRWDASRKDFQRWLASEATCTPAAMVQDLRGLVTRFGGIRDRARGLSRTSLTRPVADPLLEAVDLEDKALARLRDSWKPNDQGPFLVYEQDRRGIEQARRRVAEQAAGLKTVSVAERQQAVTQFTSAWESVARDWDAFHRDWDTWRGQEGTRPVAQIARELHVFSERFQGVLTRLHGLPRPPLATSIAEALILAGDREGGALERLRDRYKPDEPATFETFERDRRAAAAERRKGADRLEELARQTAEERQEALDAFTQAFAALDRDWSTFQGDYDVWRNKDGNCQRDAVRSKLDEFIGRFRETTIAAQGLRRTSPAKPLADLLTDAAQREQAALQSLRDAWRPYDDSAFKAYEQEQIAIDDLRVRAAVGLQEVAERYGLTIAPARPAAEAPRPTRSP